MVVEAGRLGYDRHGVRPIAAHPAAWEPRSRQEKLERERLAGDQSFHGGQGFQPKLLIGRLQVLVMSIRCLVHGLGQVV